MTDKKISQLPTLTQANVAGDVEVPAVASGDTKKVNLAAILAGMGVTGHIDDEAKHRVINDTGTAETDLLSAQKIIALLADKAAASHEHNASAITAGTLPVARGGTGLNAIALNGFLYAATANTLSVGSFNTNHFAFTSNVLGIVADSVRQRVGVQKGGGTVTNQPILNFIEGAGVTITITEDPDDKAHDIEIEAGGGTDGWELITSTTFSGQSLVAFNGILDASIYSQVQFDLDIVPDVDAIFFGCHLGNGGTYETAAANYHNSLTIDGAGQNFTDTYLNLMYQSSSTELGNTGYESYSAIVDVKNWGSATRSTKVQYVSTYEHEAGTLYHTIGGGSRRAAAAHTDIRFYGDDNFSGTIYAWGKRYA